LISNRSCITKLIEKSFNTFAFIITKIQPLYTLSLYRFLNYQQMLLFGIENFVRLVDILIVQSDHKYTLLSKWIKNWIKSIQYFKSGSNLSYICFCQWFFSFVRQNGQCLNVIITWIVCFRTNIPQTLFEKKIKQMRFFCVFSLTQNNYYLEKKSSASVLGPK